MLCVVIPQLLLGGLLSNGWVQEVLDETACFDDKHTWKDNFVDLLCIGVSGTCSAQFSILCFCVQQSPNIFQLYGVLLSHIHTDTHPIMVARSFSSSALILLLLVSVSSAARIVSYDESSYIDSTSRASVRRTKKPKKTPKRPKPSSKPKRPKKPTGREPVFTAISAKQVKAVWGATTILSKGTKPSSSLNSLAGWDQIEAEILAAGGTVAGPTGGASDRARCHMIGDALGGKGKKNNLFTCFAYFNNPGMFYFENELRKEIRSLRGTDRCEMTVTLRFTTKKYPTSVNMNAKCRGSQFFNVNIDNALQPSNVAVQHLCRPSFPLQSGSFRGTSTIASGAGVC